MLKTISIVLLMYILHLETFTLPKKESIVGTDIKVVCVN